ncbi:MAG TPA: DUF485 domain-containing protein, partial [Azospirillaceae bacterium]|nr:DUF485 domain-containing protein [Azospirillaceae bacterium]
VRKGHSISPKSENPGIRGTIKTPDSVGYFSSGGNMAQETYERIRSNPKFQEFVSKRNSYSIVMSILMIIAYYGYILLIAFNKPFLATKLSAGAVTSVGIPMGVGVILFTIILTWIYVRRANTEFDTEAEQIISEAQK